MKKILILLIFLVLFSPKYIFAQTIKMPSLSEVMEQNQEKLQKNFEENNSKNNEKVIILDEQKKFFTYENIYSSNSIKIQKSTEENFFVSEIDLSKWVKIDGILWWSGFVEETGEPLFLKKSINETLEDLLRKPKIIINWQFFNPVKNPTTLSFATKNNGIIRTAGADNKDDLLLLTVNENIAKIESNSWKNLENANWDFGFASFSIKKKSYPNEKIGRTYLCLADSEGKNFSSKIKIFVAEAITENDIENEMLKQNCNEKTSLQLDSSGSSRFFHNDKTIYGFAHKWEADKRKIPHYIMFFD